MLDPNRLALQKIANALGEMNAEVVYVGGAIAGLLITDPGSPSIRSTDDVDCIVKVASRSEYDHRIRELLLERGFKEMIGEGIPICAWQKDDTRLDVMPTDESILGFSSVWYLIALETATEYELGSDKIRVISPPAFLATKLAAFHARGQSDYLFSHDMEDIIALLDGRETITQDVHDANRRVRAYVAEQFRQLLADAQFVDDLPRLIPDPARVGIVSERMVAIAAFANG